MNYIPLRAAMVSNYENGGGVHNVSISGASIEAVGVLLNAHSQGVSSYAATQLNRTINPDELGR